jgi:hypothetical protein
VAREETMKRVPTNHFIYRLNQNRVLSGGKKLLVINTDKILPLPSSRISVGFESNKYAILENAGTLSVYVERHGGID